MRLLESPLYENMAETAFLVDEIAKELQQLRQKGSDNLRVLHVADALEHPSNRLRPVLTQALAIVPTATPSLDDIKAFATAISTAQNILSKVGCYERSYNVCNVQYDSMCPYCQLHDKASTIVLEDRQSPAAQLLSTSPILEHIQGALSRVRGEHLPQWCQPRSCNCPVSGVDPALLNRHEPSLLEKFVVFDYIPNAERIFSLEKALEESSTEEARPLLDPSSKIAFLQRRWQTAHHSLEQSARKHLQRIMQALRSTSVAGDADDERKMAAVARFVEKASWTSVRRHLQDVAKELQEIAHSNAVVRFKQGSFRVPQPFTLPTALALVYQLHEMLPKLKDAHRKLHSLQTKLRLLSARAARHDEASMRLLQKNDNLRLRMNRSVAVSYQLSSSTLRRCLRRLKRDLSSLRKALRQQSAAALGVPEVSKGDSFHVDLMKPLERFASLEKEVTKRGSKPRFSKELEELRSVLKDIHLTAAQLRRLT